MKGIDLTGRTAIVTGGYSGSGTAVIRGLSEARATVVVAARRPDQARKEIGDVARVEISELDLAPCHSHHKDASETGVSAWAAAGRAPVALPSGRPPHIATRYIL